MKYLEIHLPYFKQGDDLNCCLDSEKTKREAFFAHAEMLNYAASQLKKIGELIDETVEVDADTHHIGINCSDEIAEKLISLELAEVPEWLEEDDEEFYDEDEELL